MLINKIKNETIKITQAPILWAIHFYRSIIGPSGYLVIASIIGIYITFYTIISAKHDRDSSGNATQLASYHSMMNSNNRLGIVSFIDDYSRIYNYQIVAEPSFFKPSTWYEHDSPNRDLLRKVAQITFNYCQPMKCSDSPNVRIDASESDLSRVMFLRTNFSYSNFARSNLMDSSLRGSNFDYSDFSNLRANKVDFSGSSMIGVNFAGAVLKDARLKTSGYGENSGVRKIVLKSANFSGANLENVDFTGANLVRSLFGTLEQGSRSTLTETKARSAKFIGANLSYASFIKTDLRGADFTDANLNDTCFEGVKYPSYP